MATDTTYRHVLCLYPYVADQRPGIGIWPPTGLEYIASAIQGQVDQLTLVVLRFDNRLPSKSGSLPTPGWRSPSTRRSWTRPTEPASV